MKLKLNLLLVGLLATTYSFAQEVNPATKPKLFAGRDQYKTFSVGVNAGALAPVVLIGGSNDYTNWHANFGYGIYLKKQLSHVFGLQINLLRGDLSGNNTEAAGGVQNGYRSFDTEIAYGADLRGVFNLGSINFMKKENVINFTSSLGYGLLAYAPIYVSATNSTVDWKGKADGGNEYVKEAYLPIGLGVKFKISDAVAFDLGYTMNFVDTDNLDANYAKQNAKDKFSYTHMGLEFALGSKSKPNLVWANPVSAMYDELKDDTLKQEVNKLKTRTTVVENKIQDLKKDSDGDGVADHLDKCPNTPSSVKVDGAGCPLNILNK